MKRRVVITGCSSITPIGQTKKEILKSLENGVSGVKPLKDDGLLTKLIHCKVFGTVDYKVEYDFKRMFRKTMGPVSFYRRSELQDEIKHAHAGC